MMKQWINTEALDVLATYYYPRAKWLQNNCNWGHQSYTSERANEVVNDPLMQNIEIYDCYTRNAAGFSNVLQDLWCKHNTPKWHHQETHRHGTIMKYDTSYWDLATWIWVFLAHRVTGSGASFQDDHGYRNSAVQYFGNFNSVQEMIDLMKTMKANKKPLFTSIGNQPPLVQNKSNLDYLSQEGVRLAQRLSTWLQEASRSHKEVVDYCNEFNKEHEQKRFNFQFAALSMDLSDYYPNLVDPESHTYLGNNAKRCLKLMFKGYREDEAMNLIQSRMGGLHKDNEDVLCDFVRFGQQYDPWKRGQFYNNSGWESGWDDRSQ